MASTPPEAQPSRRWSVRGAGVLVLLCVLTWGVQVWRVGRLEADLPGRQQAVVAEALALIDFRFGALQDEMVAVAEALTTAPTVVQALRRFGQGEPEAAAEALVAHFAAYRPPERVAVELYDPTPQLVVWQGFSMPLDEAPNSARFLEMPQTTFVDDGKRQAVVLWWPIREGGRLLGTLRVMRLVHFDVPVRNQYLRDYSLAETWSQLTGLAVRVAFAEAAAASAARDEQTRLLEGLDGTALGRVFVALPLPERLLEQTRARFRDLMMLWVILLLAWLAAGLWAGYRTALSGEPVGRRLRAPPVLWFGLWSVSWWGIRFVMLKLNVPARWQAAKAPLAPLFDPQHLASPFGYGLLQSTGDLLITAVFALVFAAAFIHWAARWQRPAFDAGAPVRQVRLRALLAGLGTAAVVGMLTAVLAFLTRHAILDSTLDYFVRTGLLPERLVLVVFCGLLLMALALVLVVVGVARGALLVGLPPHPGGLALRAEEGVLALSVVVPLALLYVATDLGAVMPWYALLPFLVIGFGVASRWSITSAYRFDLFTLRSVLPSIFVLALLLYPLLYRGLEVQRRIRMVDAADSFNEGEDPRVMHGIKQLLSEVQEARPVRQALAVMTLDEAPPAGLDSLAQAYLRGSLLASLGAYDVSLTFFDTTGAPVGRHYETDQPTAGTTLDQVERAEFDLLRMMYAEDRATGIFMELVTGRREPDRYQYEGITPIYVTTYPDAIGWVMARAEPQVQAREGNTPFPRVLLPATFYGNLHADLSLAAFQDGLLTRSIGRNFGRYRLGEDVQQQLRHQDELWERKEVREHGYLTYYRRDDRGRAGAVAAPLGRPAQAGTVAVRIAAINLFDHLYYLLRLTVSGLFIGLPLYLMGLYLRRRAGLLPAPRTQFRSKVLNAFFAVGIITAAAMGFAGLRVVTGENERAIQSWLEQHLERVEETLALDARNEELPYRVLTRTHVDSLAARVGLDLNVYRGTQLMATSRPQLTRDRLIDERLPIQAHHMLYYEGFRFTATEEQVGSFTYTAGYRALPDEQGRPYFVISVPTLPEQERIEEERARTVAYLFGALLVLVLIVMLTASLLATRLTRPIARLRAGLEAVARGRFARIPPVRSRDEIGELVQTFNTMQEQIADSRRQLAQQERQLAWREMARQVAHEIKNPLTPMKLSVQHLRRAYDKLRQEASQATDPEAQRFDSLFSRITTTLIEQIDALARIANEFSTFARMPHRVLEELDLNAVVSEAVALMQEEAHADVHLALADAPLVLKADREELRRIYINLIKNALQAMPAANGGAVRVATHLEPGVNGDPGWAYSTVADVGTGIPAELRGKIFEPNFSTKTSGTGLGLAIVKKGVEDLQGEIDFETEEGVGTTFRIRLPLIQTAL